MKKVYLIIMLMITMIFTGCSSYSSEDRVLSNAQWIEDIDFLEGKLRDYHLDLFKYLPEDEFNKSIEKLKVEVPKLSDSDIKLKIAQIIASIGDAHTGMFPSEILSPVPSQIPPKSNPTDIKGVVEFPIKCDYFDDGLRVVECDSKYKEILGYKLISINNINIDNIIEDISTLIGGDYGNKQMGRYYSNQILNAYEILKYFNVVDSDKAEYSFENDNNEKINVYIKAKNNEQIDYMSVNKKEMKTNIKPKDADTVYWYNSFNEDDILFFKFNSFATDTSGEKGPNFNDFLEGLLQEINENKCNKLVIDVRENGGGSREVLNALIENIDYRTELEGEDIYIITGKKSNSASTLLSFDMQSKKGATIVGEETGGNINLFSAGGQIELPHSKLKPVISSSPIVSKKGYNGGVKADIEVKQNYEDYINGIDTCYERIKDINKN